MIGEPGKGIKLISGMLTITRIHNAIAACSFMRRMNHLARDYATKRSAFGHSLHQQPAHVSVNRDLLLLEESKSLKAFNFFSTKIIIQFDPIG